MYILFFILNKANQYKYKLFLKCETEACKPPWLFDLDDPTDAYFILSMWCFKMFNYFSPDCLIRSLLWTWADPDPEKGVPSFP